MRPTANLELVTLQNPNTQQRIVVMWTRYDAAETVTLAATALSATLVLPDGATQAITPLGGVYNITLPAATNPYLAKVLLGEYPTGVVAPWLNAPCPDRLAPVHRPPDRLVQEGTWASLYQS